MAKLFSSPIAWLARARVLVLFASVLPACAGEVSAAPEVDSGASGGSRAGTGGALAGLGGVTGSGGERTSGEGGASSGAGGSSGVGGMTGTGGNRGMGGATPTGGTRGVGGMIAMGGRAGGLGGAGGSASGTCAVAPVNPNATPQAKKLLCYLYSLYGNHVLSGQQETSWNNPANDITYYTSMIGKAPAILGGDYLYPSGTSSRAIAYWNAGGISVIRYHMGAPPTADSYQN